MSEKGGKEEEERMRKRKGGIGGYKLILFLPTFRTIWEGMEGRRGERMIEKGRREEEERMRRGKGWYIFFPFLLSLILPLFLYSGYYGKGWREGEGVREGVRKCR